MSASPDKLVQMTEQRFDSEVTQGWLSGHAAGVEAAVAWLKQQAMEAFGKKDDKRAYQLRDVADDLVRYVIPDLQVAAEKHKVDYCQDEDGDRIEDVPR